MHKILAVACQKRDNHLVKKMVSKLYYFHIILHQSLSIIFNHSFNTGIVPDDWKKANVSAIFKKG